MKLFYKCYLAFAICDFKSCQKACARMLLSSMAEVDSSGTNPGKPVVDSDSKKISPLIVRSEARLA